MSEVQEREQDRVRQNVTVSITGFFAGASWAGVVIHYHLPFVVVAFGSCLLVFVQLAARTP